MAIKIAYQTLTWARYPKDFTVKNITEEVKEAGYNGIEYMESVEQLGDPKELKKMLDGMGMTLASLSCGVSGKRGDEESMKIATARVDYAGEFGVKALMVGGGGRDPSRETTEDDYKALAENLEELAQYATQYDIAVAYHPHIGCIVETNEEVDRLFQYTELTGLCPDIAHLAAKGSDPIKLIEKYPDKIAYIHLKDWNSERCTDKNFWMCFVELGEGNIGLDIPGVLSALEKIGYDGWAGIELDNTTRTPLESAKISREYLRGIGY